MRIPLWCQLSELSVKNNINRWFLVKIQIELLIGTPLEEV